MNAVLTERTREARAALDALYGAMRPHGLGVPAGTDGQLIRPLLAMAGRRRWGSNRMPASGRRPRQSSWRMRHRCCTTM